MRILTTIAFLLVSAIAVARCGGDDSGGGAGGTKNRAGAKNNASSTVTGVNGLGGTR
jgi:hypothetical protein